MNINDNEAKMIKFSLLIEDIDKEIPLTPMIGNIDYKGINPLKLIFDYNQASNYSKKIMDKVNIRIENGLWNERYTLDDFQDNKKRVNAINEFIKDIRDNRKKWTLVSGTTQDKFRLMFWIILITIIEMENYNNNLSLISDLAYSLRVNDKTIKDIIKCIKVVLGEYREDTLEIEGEWVSSDIFEVCRLFKDENKFKIIEGSSSYETT